MTNGKKLVEEIENKEISKNNMVKQGEEFTEGKAELRAYQFNKYISSCTSYLMDQRLKEKRKLYNGADAGFVPERVKELLESKEIRDINGVNPVIRSVIREINKEENLKRQCEKEIENKPKIKVNAYYEDELDSYVVRILYDALSITNQFGPVFVDKLEIEEWISNSITYISKIRNVKEADLWNMNCIVTLENNKDIILKTSELSDIIFNFIKELYENEINNIEFSNHTETLSNMLQNRKLQDPNIIENWGNFESRSEQVMDDFMTKLENNHFDISEPQMDKEFNPTTKIIEQHLQNYQMLLESGLIQSFEDYVNELEEQTYHPLTTMEQFTNYSKKRKEKLKLLSKS